MTRIKRIIILAVTLLLVAFVYGWFFILNKGQLILSSAVTNYDLQINESTYHCDENPCTIQLKVGAQVLKITKNNYFPTEELVFIKRGEAYSLSIELKKIPQLTISPIIPPDNNEEANLLLPDLLRDRSISSAAWNNDATQLAFIDLIDGRLKIWKSNALQTVTPISATEVRFYWSPDQSTLFGYQNHDFYVIYLPEASKKKIINDFIPIDVEWSLDNSYVLINDAKNKLYRFNVASQSIEELGFYVDLGSSHFLNSNELVFYTNSDELTRSTIQTFNPIDESIKTIIEADFLIDRLVSYDDNLYLRDQNLHSWYWLETQ